MVGLSSDQSRGEQLLWSEDPLQTEELIWQVQVLRISAAQPNQPKGRRFSWIP